MLQFNGEFACVKDKDHIPAMCLVAKIAKTGSLAAKARWLTFKRTGTGAWGYPTGTEKDAAKNLWMRNSDHASVGNAGTVNDHRDNCILALVQNMLKGSSGEQEWKNRLKITENGNQLHVENPFEKESACFGKGQ